MEEDWRSYDGVAQRYDTAWSSRFEQVAGYIWSRVPVGNSDTILDVGSGTGIVLRVLKDTRGRLPRCVACDRSLGMLRRAAANAPGCNVVAADGTALPFASGTFDVVTASFVLSHIPAYEAALAEMHRVLKPRGTAVVTNWVSVSEVYGSAWNEYLSEVVAKAEIEAALAQVAPCEEQLARPGVLGAALAHGGFVAVALDAVDVVTEYSVEQFLDDRELNSSGRLAQHRLGVSEWRRFRTAIAERLRDRFGPTIRYPRTALVASARKPAD